jgi:nucleotide-binding universal stress UspA family protein
VRVGATVADSASHDRTTRWAGARGTPTATPGAMIQTQFTHILVPYDFGEVAEHALDVAIGLAAAIDAKVTIFHAAWMPATATVSFEGLTWPTDEFERQARQGVARVLARVKERHGEVAACVVTGDPREVIVETVGRLHADLIVMGTHGRRGLSRALLGSVAERIVRTSPVPVLTVSLAGRANEGRS